jgi:hypothetical protein
LSWFKGRRLMTCFVWGATGSGEQIAAVVHTQPPPWTISSVDLARQTQALGTRATNMNITRLYQHFRRQLYLINHWHARSDYLKIDRETGYIITLCAEPVPEKRNTMQVENQATNRIPLWRNLAPAAEKFWR